MSVEIPSRVCHAIVEHARREAPNEACGLLLGVGDQVLEVWPSRNELASPTRYRVDARDHFAALKAARQRGVDIIGAFHSHPRTPPLPSETDREEAWPGFLYLIISLDHASASALRGWRLVAGNFEEVPLVIRAGEVESPCMPSEPTPFWGASSA